MMGLTRLIFHTTIGIMMAIVPLIVGTIPFMARQLESAMEEIPDGIVEASISMGMSTGKSSATSIFVRIFPA